MRHRRLRRVPEAGVNMTPMIDMVFILLIFFIVTTSFLRETAVDIRRPASLAAVAITGTYLPIVLTAGGRVHLESGIISIDDRAAIAAALGSSGGQRIVIRADRAASTGDLLRLMDTCRAAGALSVDVAAERPR